MKYILSVVFLICTVAASSQQYLDKKIIVTVSDTANIYQRVRIAFGKNNFQLKEDGNYSIVTSFPRELKKIPGYAIGRAEINGNIITITGVYGLTRVDDWGYTRTPNNYKEIMYMKNSKTWPLLYDVAKNLDGTITYSK